MNFGNFLDNNSCGGGARIISNNFNSMPRGGVIATARTMFNSPGLSLALQTNMEGQGANIEGRGEAAEENFASSSVNVGEMRNRDEPAENFASSSANVGERRNRDEATNNNGADDNNNSNNITIIIEGIRSESDNMEGASRDVQDAATDGPARKKKKYHRHTPQQIEELEALFKECPHPDEKQRLELSQKLSLETRQVKFWFQNRRSQMKTQIERHENSKLREDNDKLRAENVQIREATRNPICTNCGGPAVIGEVSLEEQQLRIENARLKEELERLRAIAGTGEFGGLNPIPSSLSMDFGIGMPSSLTVVAPSRSSMSVAGPSHERSLERSMYSELALAAMDELVRMAHIDEPLWLKSFDGGRDILNHEEYQRSFAPCIGMKPIGFVTEASRENGMIIINSLALVETLMDSNKWAQMFPCIVASATTTEEISNGMGGTRNGALQLMNAQLQVLSPLVPVRGINFLRFCKQHAEGVWAVVDVSIDAATGDNLGGQNCRRLPSGCVVQDMHNGYSKITWVEHAEYDESAVHQLYRPLINAGMGFGAQRWVATLQRECECLAILMSSNEPSGDPTEITAAGRRSMLKLAQRMTHNFCAGVCASTHNWNELRADNIGEGVRVMTRQSIDDPGEPSGIVLSAATSLWLPVSPERLFNFLRDERLRSEWDILSNGGPMQEMAHIAKGQDRGNCVSLLRSSAMNVNQSPMLIIQETCIDASGMLVVYAPVDIPAVHMAMNGGDSAYVAVLPSGFAIVADGASSHGSILTVAFQILVNSLPTARLTVESVEMMNNLIACTVQKIKSSLQCET